MLTLLLNDVLELVYPPRCLLCGDILVWGGRSLFCDICANKLPYIEKPVCIKCGRAVENVNTSCNYCQNVHYDFQRNAALFVYEGDVREAVHRFKFKGHSYMGVGFGALMAELYDAEFGGQVDVLVPVPMHVSKLRKRGFNQSETLALEISRRRGVPVAGRWIIRMRNTMPQSELPAPQREANVRGAFGPGPDSKSFEGTRALLVDDIFTTGSTASACAKALLENGAASVAVITLAATRAENHLPNAANYDYF